MSPVNALSTVDQRGNGQGVRTMINGPALMTVK
jgi:hypothetical protein